MPADSDPPDPAQKFPIKNWSGPILALPRRRPTTAGARSPLDLSTASAEARRSIDAIVSATRTPWTEGAPLTPSQSTELETSLRLLEIRLEERERAAEELEARLADWERDLAEMGALLAAREKVLDAARRAAPAARPGVPVSAEEKTALEALKAEVDRQEASLKEQRVALADRERFVNETEAKLFEKMMQQQEQETEIEQKLEEIGLREKHLRDRETAIDPQAAAAAKAVEPAKKLDEFNE